ncbi:MAG: tetratricopeptide repeat protein [Paracoccaceae bacterium]
MRYLSLMKAMVVLHNRIVAAVLMIFLGAGVASAQTAELDDLFKRLGPAEPRDAENITRQIWIEWSKSGSPAMDLLLERGRAAMTDGMPDVAMEHLTALIDHAPEFAEGWNARATAYFQTGNLGPSISDIGQVLQLNPRHFGALSGLGMIFEELEKPEQALEAYRAALAINPHMADVVDAVERLESETAGQDL